jgi:hypothetical protein
VTFMSYKGTDLEIAVQITWYSICSVCVHDQCPRYHNLVLCIQCMCHLNVCHNPLDLSYAL